jgi:putative transposase
LAKAISDVGWSRLRRWVEYYGRLHYVPVVAIPPQDTTQDCSGVLPDGTPCRARIRKTLSLRTQVCPRCGLVLDRDHNAAAVILQRGLELAQAEGHWPSETREQREQREQRGSVGHTGT